MIRRCTISFFKSSLFQRGRSSSSSSKIISDASFSSSESPTAILLIAEDYPPSFRGRDGGKVYAHKDDYKITFAPIKPEVFLYRGSDGLRDRLFIRTSIKMNDDPKDNRFTSATFLFDTGCCPHFNLSDELKMLLKDRIKKDEGREFFISTMIDQQKHQCVVKTDLPDQHKTVNVMGLPMLFALGIAFKKGRVWSFELDHEDVAHDVATFGDFKFI